MQNELLNTIKKEILFLQIKYKALTESSFRFFRGTCHLFYEGLIKKIPVKYPTKIWICDDLHLENFGTYKGNNGLVYFDMNDFDKAILAPATWEVMRTLTSIYIVTVALKKQDIIADRLAACFINTYIKNILTGKPLAFERDITKGLIKTFITIASKRKSLKILEGRLLFKGIKASLKIINGKTVAIKDNLKKPILSSIKTWCKKNKYIHCKVCNTACLIAGAGSLGITRFIILMYDKIGKRYFFAVYERSIAILLTTFY